MQISKWKKLIHLWVIVALLILVLIGCTVLPDQETTQQEGTQEAQLPQPKTLTDPREIEIYSAIQKAASGREDLLAFLIYKITLDYADFSRDGSVAIAWLSMVDKTTGLVQNSEPALAIAHATADASSPWRITFQVDATFAQELTALPDSLISAEAKAHYMPAVQQEQKAAVVYRGYKLPWAKDKGVYLTGSIGHVFVYKSCPSTCLYAFDFADGTMFEIRAAKHGYVKYAQWTYANGNTTDANYIILEDPSTTPTTYQVYYHLAQNSIPAALRVPGAEVMQGQFIGNVDDTGYSSGHHLHFHVHTASGSVWGTSVDIVFDEVSVNGGRPRTCSEASAYPDYGSQCISGNKYYSQNADSANPTGAITSPPAYSVVTSPTLNVSGWMNDDTAIDFGQLMVNTGSGWESIGDPLTVTPFTREINLCNARIPDGTFFLSIVVKDKAGKTSVGTQGLTELTKAYSCTELPPTCTPDDNQVALFTEVDYQGTCKVLDIGDYPNLGVFNPSFLDTTRSMAVGSGVSVLLYPDPDFGGNFEFFQDGDANLADNYIGAYNAGSIKVLSRITPPAPPQLILPETISTTLDLTLSWTAGVGEQTRTTLVGPSGYSQSLDWQDASSWYVGLLPQGQYQWTVETRNLAGNTSISQEFDVLETTILPISRLNSLPAMNNSAALLLTWEVDQGADTIDHFELQTRTPDGDWTDWAVMPDGAERQLLVWATPGQTVQYRLRAVDALGNVEEYPADPEAQVEFASMCAVDQYEGADPGDDDISGASLIEIGTTQTHNWCAPDLRADGSQMDNADWISFSAASGDQLRFTINPSALASAAVMSLFDTDGVIYIGEARPANSQSSASLDWTAPADGVYYLKLNPVDPRIRGTDTQYLVNIELKGQIQPATLVCGSAAIPALLAGGYAVSKQVKKQKKRMERKTLGR